MTRLGDMVPASANGLVKQYARAARFVPCNLFFTIRTPIIEQMQMLQCIPLALTLQTRAPSGNLFYKRKSVTDSSQSAPGSQNWKLTLAYDGTDFSGWQVQPGAPTIQGQLQMALRRVASESPLPQGSGRTDAGVHALGQVASFHLQARIPPKNLLRALNRTLPPSIRVLESRTVPSTFHARHSALAKTYEYRVFRQPICPPSLARYVHTCPWPLDVETLQESAQFFVGKHDFLSFAATDPDLAIRNSLAESAPNLGHAPGPNAPVGAIRTIFASTWEAQHTDSGSLLLYRVRGSGFLHHMVRNLVGTMLDVGRGHLLLSEIPSIIAARSRSAAGPTAPAQGLFLHSVEYPPFEEPPSFPGLDTEA
jgi:tRNA pseudouridine38-40 synthase